MVEGTVRRRTFVGMGASALASATLAQKAMAQENEGPEILNVVARTSVRDEELTVLVEYEQEGLDGAEFIVEVSEMDHDRSGLPSARVPVEESADKPAARQTITLPWPNARLWNIGDPYLYLLHVAIVDVGGMPIVAYEPVRFGFREVWVEGKDVILNGQPIKLRLAPFQHNLGGMLFYAGMGMNTLYFQPNPTRGWSDGCAEGPGWQPSGVRWGRAPELLDEADERGWAVFMPTRSANPIESELSEADEGTIEEYLNGFWHCGQEFDRQNRPSILAWALSMNRGHHGGPDELGRHPGDDEPAWYEVVEDLVRAEDPTRLVYHHQGGQNGDFEMPNVFLNLVPLQEREDYLSEWSVAGKKPFGVAEHGPPLTGNFFRGRLHEQGDGIPYLTEYFSIYLGDDAYMQETDSYVQDIEAVTQDHDRNANGGRFQASGRMETWGESTALYDFYSLFIRNTNKAWRAWGVNCGLFPWIQDIGFGIPPDHQHKTLRWGDFDYPELERADETIAERPDWANPVYDAYRDTMQSLLVFIGGPEERSTAKDHTYRSGERIEKTIVAVWDGPASKRFTAEWSLRQEGEVVASGVEHFDLPQGTVEKRPIQFEAPAVVERTKAQLDLRVHEQP